MKSDMSVECNKWVRSVQLVAHTVEVRSLVHFKGKLFSGGNYITLIFMLHLVYRNNIYYFIGIDGYLSVSSYPPKHMVKYPPLMPVSYFSLIEQVKYMYQKL